MLFAFILLILVTVSGFVVTYSYDQDAPFAARLCAGIVVGQVLYALVGVSLGFLIGMSANVALTSAIVTALPLIALAQIKNAARRDCLFFFKSVKTSVLHRRFGTMARAALYICLVVFLWLFFERAMLIINGGIGTGSLHNYGDISFHLQAIYGFLDGQNYPPQNPSFAGAKFTYPFMADLITAMLAAVGARISEAMMWQNIFLSVGLIGIMHRFTLKLTGNKLAADVAPFILLFSGGTGFLLFFSDALKDESGLLNSFLKMPDNYTIRPATDWRWGNSLTTLFMTQRSILLGLPLALIIFTKVWEIFADPRFWFSNSKTKVESLKQTSLLNSIFSKPNWQVFVIGLLAGTLPLVHAHSFAVVMGMTGCLALISWRQWREWAIFFLAASVVSVPELLWAIVNSASKAGNFIDWQFGWDNSNGSNFFYFWLKNTGFFIPLLLAAIGLLILRSQASDVRHSDAENAEGNVKNLLSTNCFSPLKLLLFWLPFALCFIVPNVVRLAPWIWDNVKVLIYWFTISIPIVAWLLAQIWQSGKFGKALTIVLLISLTLSGFLDVWRVASGQMEYQVFDRDAIALARQARQKTPPTAIVMSAPTFDSPAALMGRRWFLGFTTHLWSHGIDAAPREAELREIYFGGSNAGRLLSENNIDYIVVGPQENQFTVVNKDFLSRFPVVAQEGEYSLLKVK